MSCLNHASGLRRCWRPRFSSLAGPVFFCLRLALLTLVPPPLPSAAGEAPGIEWVADYNGPDSYWEEVRGAAIHDGSLHVTGFAHANFWRAIATVKYDAAGNELWSRLYEGFSGPNQPDEPHDLAVDGSGFVYVVGHSVEYTDSEVYVDVAVLKYSPGGDLVWEQRHRAPGRNAQPEAVVIDPTGSIYIAGAAWVEGGFDVMLLKYDLDGNLQWVRTRGGSGDHWDAGLRLSLDLAGNILVGGYKDAVPGNPALYILKYCPDGSLAWERVIDGFSNYEQVEDLVSDAEGDVCVTGRWNPPFGNGDILTVKLASSDGHTLWEDVYNGTGPHGDHPSAIRIAPDGDILVAGTSWEDPNNIRFVLMRFSPEGTRLWTRFHAGGYANSTCEDLAVDGDGDVYLTGYAYDQNGYEDYLTVKFDASGDEVWSSSWAAPEGRSDYAKRIFVDDGGRVFVVGDAWRELDEYINFTSVVYGQDSPAAVSTPAFAPTLGRSLRFRPDPAVTGRSVVLDAPLGAGPVKLFSADGRLMLRLEEMPSRAGRFEVAGTKDRVEQRFEAPAPGIYFARARDMIGRLVVTGR